ncbi:DUF952 domain-containing protein [Nocardioides humilatus]|uniref:DUF952 domain-containing protein n=1 Tax=Nocardioides humilatus TaxID=2607660 RepID=A0A5B1LJV0_9ACTN|nr:DUF952 domain-containing protein [Nocardioides humilatus]KAA1420823.1 DUF952 domain-containing protein [Nocardioides humilatus]
MATIFHLALASDWAAAQQSGAYTISTLGRSLAEEGFIHASRADQWTAVRERFYGDVVEPLLLLQIDTGRLDVPVIEEPPAPGVTETFPHIYGPLPVGAVVKAIPLSDVADPTMPTPAREASFSRYFLGEMYRNMTLILLVMVFVMIGFAISTAFGDRIAPLIGMATGLVVGVLSARAIYRRRHP